MKKWAIFITLFLSGCASTPEEIPTASELYAEARNLHDAAQYAEADAKFSELASTYPTSPYAQQAILDQVYFYLQRREYNLAINSANEFIDLYPDHEQIPYALYMKGVVYFREDRGILDRIGQQDPSQRDSRLMRLSFESFRELIDRFPDSSYASDATLRMRYLINALAKGEMHVAAYYYRRGGYLAVIERVENILDVYPDSIVLEEALVLLVDAYEKLGATSSSADARRLLEVNFPNRVQEE